MSEEIKPEGNSKLTDEQLKKLSLAEIKGEQYTGDDRRRWDALQEDDRHARYTKDPYSFIEIKDIICCAIHSAASNIGIAIMIPPGTSWTLLNNALVELEHMAEKMRMQRDIDAAAKIQAAHGMTDQLRPHNMRDGVRRMFGKGHGG